MPRPRNWVRHDSSLSVGLQRLGPAALQLGAANHIRCHKLFSSLHGRVSQSSLRRSFDQGQLGV